MHPSDNRAASLPAASSIFHPGKHGNMNFDRKPSNNGALPWAWRGDTLSMTQVQIVLGFIAMCGNNEI